MEIVDRYCLFICHWYQISICIQGKYQPTSSVVCHDYLKILVQILSPQRGIKMQHLLSFLQLIQLAIEMTGSWHYIIEKMNLKKFVYSRTVIEMQLCIYLLTYDVQLGMALCISRKCYKNCYRKCYNSDYLTTRHKPSKIVVKLFKCFVCMLTRYFFHKIKVGTKKYFCIRISIISGSK